MGDGMAWDGMGCDEMRCMYVCCIDTHFLSVCVEGGRERVCWIILESFE